MAGDRVEFQQSTDGAAISNMAKVAADSQCGAMQKFPVSDTASSSIPKVELFDSAQGQIDCSPGANNVDSETAPDRPDAETAPDRPDSEAAPDSPDSETAPDRPDADTAPDRPEDMAGAACDLGSLLKDGAKQGQISPWLKERFFQSQIRKL